MKCPDCKDGFYYPFVGPREKCKTCYGAIEIPTAEITIEIFDPAALPLVYGGFAATAESVAYRELINRFTIAKLKEARANILARGELREISRDSRQSSPWEAENRSPSTIDGPCGAD